MGIGSSRFKHIKKGNPAQQWQELEALGQGSYGKVSLVKHKTDNTLAAAKIAVLKRGEDDLDSFLDEISCLVNSSPSPSTPSSSPFLVHLPPSTNLLKYSSNGYLNPHSKVSFPHTNITGFIGGFFFENTLWIVIEVCSGGSLSDVLKRRKRGLEEHQIQWYLNIQIYAYDSEFFFFGYVGW